MLQTPSIENRDIPLHGLIAREAIRKISRSTIKIKFFGTNFIAKMSSQIITLSHTKILAVEFLFKICNNKFL